MSGDYAILASIYDRIEMAAFAESITESLLTYAQQNEWLGRRILELGCGTGVGVSWFASHGYNATAVDIEPEMIRYTKARLQRQSLNANLLEQDILNLAVPDTYDMALALDVMNEFDNLRELQTVFQNVNNVLGKGKLLIFDLHTIEGLVSHGLGGDRIVHDDNNLVVFARSEFDFERQGYAVEYDIFLSGENNYWTRQKAKRLLRSFPIQAVATLLRRYGFEIMSIMDTNLTSFDVNKGAASRAIIAARKV